MYKLLIIFLVGFIFFRILGFLFRIMLGNPSSGRNSGHQYQNQNYKKPADGNVNIDYVPQTGKKDKPSGDLKAGEYVDYEELE